MDAALLERLRKELEGEREQLVVELRGYGADPESEKVDHIEGVDDNFADTAQSTVERAEALSFIEHAREKLGAVDHALQRMDEGTYGVCEVGGEPIPEARLEARPMSTVCVQHA